MKRNIFQICVIFIILNIISSNTKTNKASNKNTVETKTKSKDLDISEDFNSEIFFRLGIRNFKKIKIKINSLMSDIIIFKNF